MRREKLSELLDISMGRTPSRKESKYWGEGHKWVSIRDLNSKIITETKEQITDLAIKEARCKIVPKGTLLFSFKLTIGKMAFAGCDLFTNEAIAAFPIKDKTKLNSEFLYYALLSIKFGGSNQAAMGKTLNSKSLADIEIPLPPLDDQIRIAHLLGKVEALIAQRKQHLQQLDELLKSVFLEMFGDPVRNEKRWSTLPFSQVGKFTSGGTPSKSRDDFWIGDYPWVSPKDMKVAKIFDSEDHISEKVFDETSLKRIAPGHLLIVVRGMILAHSFPIAINMVDVAINQDMKAIKLKNNLRVTYVQHCLNSLKRKILKLITTAGHGTKKFDSDAMEKLFIPVPPPELQDNFLVIADKIEGIISRYQQSLTDLVNLYGALSQKAFKGELDLSRVPLPDDQPSIAQDLAHSPTPEASLAPQPQNTPSVLLDMTDVTALGTISGRQTAITQWLETYLDQVGNDASFSLEHFMTLVNDKLQVLEPEQESELPPLGIADYDQIKDWVFAALAAGKLTQGFDDKQNSVALAKNLPDRGRVS